LLVARAWWAVVTANILLLEKLSHDSRRRQKTHCVQSRQPAGTAIPNATDSLPWLLNQQNTQDMPVFYQLILNAVQTYLHFKDIRQFLNNKRPGSFWFWIRSQYGQCIP
jgi:hypothetical protein